MFLGVEKTEIDIRNSKRQCESIAFFVVFFFPPFQISTCFKILFSKFLIDNMPLSRMAKVGTLFSLGKVMEPVLQTTLPSAALSSFQMCVCPLMNTSNDVFGSDSAVYLCPCVRNILFPLSTTMV